MDGHDDVLTELAAQVTDVGVHRAGTLRAVEDPCQEFLAGESASRSDGQDLQECAFAGGQLDGVPAIVVIDDVTLLRVEPSPADRQRRGMFAVAAQQRAQPRQQLGYLERLDQVVIGAGIRGPGSNGAKNNEVRVAPGPGRRTSRCWWPLSVAAVGTEEAGDAAHGRR